MSIMGGTRLALGLTSVACWAWTVSACVSIPAFQGNQTPPPASDLVFSGTTLTGSAANMPFEIDIGSDAWPYISGIKIANSPNLLLSPSMPDCYTPIEMGVMLAPAQRISAAGSNEPMGSNTGWDRAPTYRLITAAAMTMEVDWAATILSTTSSTQTAAGSGFSELTVFPDGTIYRYDSLDFGLIPLAGGGLASSYLCGPAASSEWVIGSYASFPYTGTPGSAGVTVYNNGDSGSAFDGSQAKYASACYDDGANHQLLATWNASGGGDEVSLLRDNHVGSGAPSEVTIGVQTPPVGLDLTTAVTFSSQSVYRLAADSAGCDPLEQARGGWDFGAGITVNGKGDNGSSDYTMAMDGVFGGNSGSGSGGEPGIAVTGTTANIASIQGVPQPFAVVLDWPVEAQTLSISPNNVHSIAVPSISQAQANTSVIWFSDGLVAGSAITVVENAP
jgi:hypothetical protein